MHGIQVTNLDEPSSDTLHNLTASLETLAPVCLPFQQVAWVQSVGAKFEDAAELAWWRGWPKGELLHERNLLAVDELLEAFVEWWKLWVCRNGVQRLMVAVVLLVLPDVD